LEPIYTGKPDHHEGLRPDKGCDKIYSRTLALRIFFFSASADPVRWQTDQYVLTLHTIIWAGAGSIFCSTALTWAESPGGLRQHDVAYRMSFFVFCQSCLLVNYLSLEHPAQPVATLDNDFVCDP
jgi:hypothetical protein